MLYWDAEFDAYETSFDDEPTVSEKLTALDALAEPARHRVSALDLALIVAASAASVGWLTAYW
jgi:hypothetical protein